MLKRETVTWEAGSIGAKIVVQEASVLASIERGRLMAAPLSGDNQDYELAMRVLWPSLAAGTVSGEIHDEDRVTVWPFGAEVALKELPEPLVGAWLEAVYRLNPTWAPEGFFGG